MKLFTLYLCAFANLPWMIADVHKFWFNSLSFGFCLALAFDATLDHLKETQ